MRNTVTISPTTTCLAFQPALSALHLHSGFYPLNRYRYRHGYRYRRCRFPPPRHPRRVYLVALPSNLVELEVLDPVLVLCPRFRP
jgi:hypothetical protein